MWHVVEHFATVEVNWGSTGGRRAWAFDSGQRGRGNRELRELREDSGLFLIEYIWEEFEISFGLTWI